jgi:hypothetical protein
VNIIPQGALDCLPLSAEPLSQWNEKTDLLQFLYELLDTPALIIPEGGTTIASNYRRLAPSYFEDGKKNALSWIKIFTDCAEEGVPVPAAVVKNIGIYDYTNSPLFGRVVKYIVAWDRVVGTALEEGAFFSIAHVLESADDINCSLYLAAHLYYKQALQVLRGYLENLVLPIHFCEHPKEFLAWKANNYRVPSLRGKDGILSSLTNKNVVSNHLAEEVSNIYGNLNGCIHGSEKRLIHKGLFSGTYMGHVFKEDDFGEWCNYFWRSVDVGIKLLAINFEQWQNIRSAGEVMCTICHNNSDFDMRETWFGKHKFYIYKCRACGDEMRIAAERRPDTDA